MIPKILLTLASIAITAVLYHAGGLSKEAKDWIPKFMRRSWVRDWLCPLFNYLILVLWWHPATLLGWLMFIPAYGLTGLAFSTYWDWL